MNAAETNSMGPTFNNSSMSYEEATKKARQLKSQGMSYPDIEKVLKEAGYLSPRTKKPVGHLAIRHMVTQLEKNEAESAKEDAAINVVAPKREKLDDLKKLLSVEGLSVDTQLRLVETILQDIKRA